MGPRAGLSSVLIVGAIVLLVAIAVGQNMGNRVLGQIATRQIPILATPIPTPSATAADSSGRANRAGTRHEVISVATDPGFPDPRLTPEPPPPETPRPQPKPTPTPSPKNTPAPDDQGDRRVPLYTSPPLPLPIITHQPETGPTDDLPVAASPTPLASGRGAALAPRPGFSGRAYPTLPPYSSGTPLP